MNCAISLTNTRYNVVVLAGGNGSRMGGQRDYIPKALSKIGSKRGIDYIMQRYQNIAHKFIIGTGINSDLLESYIKGNYSNNIEFSFESELKNNAISTLYALDHVDIRYPTIITFCDLLIISNIIISPDTLYYTNSSTTGHIGTFRHSLVLTDRNVSDILTNDPPLNTGVVGCFVLNNSIELKRIAYSAADILNDLTTDIILPYIKTQKVFAEPVECLYEYGTEDDLKKIRELWEKI